MSEFQRLKRLTKSILPNFSKRSRFYTFEDARMMIVEQGLSIPPDMLAAIIDSTAHLDSFLNGIYQVEDYLGVHIITESSTIDLAYQPKVYVDKYRIAFTITHRKLLSQEEVVIAEYQFGEAPTQDVKIEG